jgi:Mn-containing catalase
MKDMLAFLIARDTMHQQQWLAVIEELGDTDNLPIPNSFPQELENREFSYVYLGHRTDGTIPQGRWSEGPSIDGRGRFSAMPSQPLGEEPRLAPARDDAGAQSSQTSTMDGEDSLSAGADIYNREGSVSDRPTGSRLP